MENDDENIRGEENKSTKSIPWARIGHYLEQHPRIAVVAESIVYASLCFTLYQVAAEVMGPTHYQRSCPIPQTENIQGAESPERFVRVGRETFYSKIDGKEISDLVKME